MKLLLSKDGRRVKAEKRDDSTLLGLFTSTFTTDKHYVEGSKVLGVDKALLLTLIDKVRNGTVDTLEHELPGSVGDGVFAVTVRSRVSKGDMAPRVFHGSSVADVLAECFMATDLGVEPIISWDGTERLCALDFDRHDVDYDRRPSVEVSEHLSLRVQPRPLFTWVTHGRGLRLLYEAANGFTASELAGIAALSLGSLEPLGTIEFIACTRHPGYNVPGRHCGGIHRSVQGNDIAALQAWLGKKEVEEEVIDEYLAQRALSRGCRYNHSHCPVQPHEPGNREPVTVREEGIFCHACAGRGVTYGHKSPGWFPFISLCGSPVPSSIRTCVQHRTHFAHSQHVLRASLDYDETVLKAIYSAALKVTHPDDEGLDKCFYTGRDFVRYGGYWGNASGEAYTGDLAPILSTLPAGYSPERVARLQQCFDISQLGYPALEPIRGIRIYSHRLPLRDSGRVPILLHNKVLRPEAMAPFRPRYVGPSGRPMLLEEAWATLEAVFPGLDRAYVTLLLVAKGIAEGGVGIPLIFASGPTGAGKTSTVKIAAAIAGDDLSEPVCGGGTERLRQAIASGKQGGDYVVLNEVFKLQQQRLDSVLNLLLTLTPDSTSHKLYVGPVPMGRMPVCVLTDTSLPEQVAEHAQIARRLIHVPLSTAVEWDGSLQDAGLSGFEQLRVANPQYAIACDMILSHVIDTYFSHHMTLAEIAGVLGYTPLSDTETADDNRTALRRLFYQTCIAPELDGADAGRWSGKGWKRLESHVQSELVEAWKAVQDEDFFRSERCNEADWARLLGTASVRFELRHHGRRVFIRFIKGDPRSKRCRVNEELLGGKDKLEAFRSSLCGHRDSECVEPQGGGSEGVPATQQH